MCFHLPTAGGLPFLMPAMIQVHEVTGRLQDVGLGVCEMGFRV